MEVVYHLTDKLVQVLPAAEGAMHKHLVDCMQHHFAVYYSLGMVDHGMPKRQAGSMLSLCSVIDIHEFVLLKGRSTANMYICIIARALLHWACSIHHTWLTCVVNDTRVLFD